jgi:ATP-dependent DNA ligase
VLSIKTGGGVRLISRSRKDLSHQFPEIVATVERLSLREGVLEGEIVAVDETGKPWGE